MAARRAGIGTRQNPMPPILVDLRDLLQRARRALSNRQGSTAAKLARDALTRARSFRGDAKVKAKVAEMVAAAQFVLKKAEAVPRLNPGLTLHVPTRVTRSPAAHGYASIGKQLGATLVRDLAYWSTGAGATAKLWPVLKAAGQPRRLPAKDVPGTFRAVEIVYANFIQPHLHPGAEGAVRSDLRHYFDLEADGAPKAPRRNPFAVGDRVTDDFGRRGIVHRKLPQNSYDVAWIGYGGRALRAKEEALRRANPRVRYYVLPASNFTAGTVWEQGDVLHAQPDQYRLARTTNRPGKRHVRGAFRYLPPGRYVVLNVGEWRSGPLYLAPQENP